MRSLRTRLALAATLPVLLVGLAACGSSGSKKTTSTGASTGAQSVKNDPSKVPADAVAVVAGHPILKKDFDHFLQIANAQTVKNGGTAPKAGSAEDAALRQRIIQFLVRNEEIRLEADKRGLKPDATKVKAQLDSFKQQVAAQDTKEKDAAKAWQAFLTGSKISEADYQQQFEVQNLGQQIYDQVTKDVKVTADEVQKKYDALKAAKDPTVVQAKTRKTAHILVKDEKTAEKVISLLDKGGDFAKLAKQYSTDSNADQGGVYDEAAFVNFVPEYQDAAFKLATGKYTEKPVKSQFGFHVIKALGDTKPESVKPLAEVKATIEAGLLEEKKQKAADDWFTNLEKQFAPQTFFATGYSLPPAVSTGADTIPEATTTAAATDTAATDTAATDTAATDTAATDTGATDTAATDTAAGSSTGG